MQAYGVVIGVVTFALASALVLRGDRTGAEERLRSGYDPLRIMGRGGHYGAIALAIAQLSYLDGRYDDVEQLVQEAGRHSRPNDVWNRSHELSEREKLLARMGETRSAVSLARQSVAFASTGDFVLAQVDALSDLAEVLRIAGDHEGAIAALDEAIELHERKENIAAADATREVIAELRRDATSRP